jgi:DNA polymerase-1
MEMNGVYINKDKWRAIIASAQKEANLITAQITEILAPLSEQNTLFGASTVNIESQPQFLDAFRKLGYDLESTDRKILKKCDHPLASLILQFRAYEKLISTYGEAILRKIDRTTDRLHFTLHQLGADTGRLSSEKPNIQNIPQDKERQDVKISFRECFEAESGSSILTADYSQCELRILAEVSQDRRFLEIFNRGDDLHIITSQQVFGYTDKDLEIYLKIKPKDHPDANLIEAFSAEEVHAYKTVADFRDKTKTINFGIVYGLSAWSLAERFKISESEAQEILDGYFNTYVGIKQWLARNSHETLANRYAKTIIGRKKFFHLPDPEDEERFRRSRAAVRRMGNNHAIQGTNADITKEALTQLQDAYEEIEGAKLLFTVHDEIVSEVPASMAEYVAELKAEIMKEAFHRFIKTVPVGKNDKVSVTIASHWSK